MMRPDSTRRFPYAPVATMLLATVLLTATTAVPRGPEHEPTPAPRADSAWNCSGRHPRRCSWR